MLKKLLATTNEWHLTIMRLAVGIMILPHGLQKTLGWYGGRGFQGQIDYFSAKYHLPVPLTLLAIAAENLGGIGLILGCLTRVAAFGVLCNMIVGGLMVALPFGFFMNWSGKQAGEGYEFHLIAIALLIAIMVKGAGPLSIDKALSKK
jgi:putative oxidoreductase